MKRFIAATTAALMLVVLVAIPATAAPAAKFSTALTEDGVTVTGSGSVANPFIITTTGVAGLAAMHPIGTTDSAAHPALQPGSYPFYLVADVTQRAALTAYFAGQWGCPTATEPLASYCAQMAKQIAGTAPFFYAVYPVPAGSTSLFLQDGFTTGLGGGTQALRINDDYPVGTYSYAGQFRDGKPFNFTFVMNLVRV